MKAHLFRVKCLTNLHVGNGESNYSIIDNEVERDPIIGEPVIFSSGVKGALREHCESSLDKNAVVDIFGSPIGGDRSGSYKFFQASLLGRPLRVSGGDRSYILASTPEMICGYLDFLTGIGFAGLPVAPIKSELAQTTPAELTNFISAIPGVTAIEGVPSPSRALPETGFLFSGQPFALTSSLAPYDLPVLARNQLNHQGISENLWYEEIVPHQSVFFFTVLAPDNDPHFADFQKSITEKAVQFGGNASIGYGFTAIEEVHNE
jgi:CRISPR-associated protein Cmr4